MSASAKTLVSPNKNENNLTKNISNKALKHNYLSKEELLETYNELLNLKLEGKSLDNSQKYSNRLLKIMVNDPRVIVKVKLNEKDFDTLEFFESRIKYLSYIVGAAGTATGTARAPIPAGRFTPLTVPNLSNKPAAGAASGNISKPKQNFSWLFKSLSSDANTSPKINLNNYLAQFKNNTDSSHTNTPSPNNKSRKSQRRKKNKSRQTIRNKH